jgi:hypothetical protein
VNLWRKNQYGEFTHIWSVKLLDEVRKKSQFLGCTTSLEILATEAYQVKEEDEIEYINIGFVALTEYQKSFNAISHV